MGSSSVLLLLAFWVYSDFWFIGENDQGAHVRVHFFPGAQVPIPQ